MYKKILSMLLFSGSCCCAYTSDEYRQQFARNPDDYRALYNAGVAAFKENNLARAQECFDLVKAVDAHKPWDALQGEQIFYNAGNTEMKLKKYEPAISSFEKVLTYNPAHELARKKLELAKNLLEQQKQEQKQDDHKQDKDNDKNKDDKKDDKKDQNKNDKEQQQKDNKQDKQDQEENSKDQEKSGNNEKQDQKKDKDNKSGNEKDEQQSQDHKEKNKEQQKPEQGSEQDKDEQAQAQQEKAGEEKNKKPEPTLTPQEQRILAYAQSMDEKMHDALNEKTLKKAQGVVRDHHNW
jgi:tetratricopeptide (TPR) repeat protein